jgi:hypothetical protein
MRPFFLAIGAFQMRERGEIRGSHIAQVYRMRLSRQIRAGR